MFEGNVEKWYKLEFDGMVWLYHTFDDWLNHVHQFITEPKWYDKTRIREQKQVESSGIHVFQDIKFDNWLFDTPFRVYL